MLQKKITPQNFVQKDLAFLTRQGIYGLQKRFKIFQYIYTLYVGTLPLLSYCFSPKSEKNIFVYESASTQNILGNVFGNYILMKSSVHNIVCYSRKLKVLCTANKKK